ncbi:rod shape-determining protein MreD, partial [Staphylococcus succinus]
LISTLILEIYVAIIYAILGLIQFEFFNFIIFRLVPTFIINFILLIIMFPVITKFLENVQMKIDSKNG